VYDSMNGNSINYQHSKTYHYEDEQESIEEQRTEIREKMQ